MGARQQILLALGGGFTNSVQNAVVVIASGATTGTVTVNSVNTTLSSLSYSGENEASTTSRSGDKGAGFVQLTNPTTLTATRQASEAFSLTKNVCLIDWPSSTVKSVQYGSAAFTSTNTTADATINAVTLANSAVMHNGWTLTTGTSTSVQLMDNNVQLTSTTNSRFHRDTGSASFEPTSYFCALEFQSGVLNSSTQQIVNSFTGATSNSTPSSVTTAQTASFWGGNTDTTSGSVMTGKVYGALAGATTFTFNKLAGTFATEGVVTLVEFKAANVKSMNRGTNTIASASSSQATTISAVNTNKTLVHQQGFGVGSTISDPDMGMPKTTLASATSVASSRVGSAAGSTSIAPFEALEFNS